MRSTSSPGLATPWTKSAATLGTPPASGGMSVHARDPKGARYALWKNVENLTDRQHAKLA